MEHLNNYLQNQGYENTILYDPSGYDVNALTTVSDLKSVSTHLLEKQWFRDIVSKSNYTLLYLTEVRRHGGILILFLTKHQNITMKMLKVSRQVPYLMTII